MKWWVTSIVLCTYGLLKEFRPSEPYLYQYQRDDLNISGDVLNEEVYPYSTYCYLVALIPGLLLTDILLYKPVLILESLSYIAVWVTLIWGRSVLTQQLGQLFYGCATATEVAYYAYIYVKVDRSKFSRVTAWTRAALQVGKFLAYFLSDIIILLNWGNYLTLNYISLGSVSLTFVFANALPFVHWKTVVNRKLQEGVKDEEVGRLDSHTLPASYREFVVDRVKEFKQRTIEIYSDMRIVKWSLWYAVATCGEFQASSSVGNYIQALWAEEQSGVGNRKVYNGFVEAAIPLISACAIMLLQKPRVNWDKWGEPVLTAAAFVDFVSLLVLALSRSIGVMYGGYAVFRVLYQMMITIAQFNIVCRIPSNSYGFVLGFNTFIALALQTILTLVVADEHGLALPIRTQFIVYAVYHAVIGLVFAVVLGARAIRSRGSVLGGV